MDKELHELEAELQKLQPVDPSARLVGRIESDLAPHHGITWAWAALPLAAALVMMFTLRSRHEVRTPEAEASILSAPVAMVSEIPDVFKPIATQNVLYATRDEGVVTLSNGRKARRVNRSYVDTVLWRNPKTNASLTWSVPRNEVQVTPVSFQ